MIEAGLGGRYDATNVIPSKVQVLTTVGLEHTRWLGPTIDGHRRREARGRPRPRDARDRAARARGRGGGSRGRGGASRSSRTRSRSRGAARCGPRGDFQRWNFAVAAAAAEAFLGRARSRSKRRRPRSRVPGRLEQIADSPLDAHRRRAQPRRRPRPGRSRSRASASPASIAILDDKDAAAMLSELLPLFDSVVFTRSAQPALPAAGDARVALHPAGRPAERDRARRRRRRSSGREQLGRPPSSPRARST